MSLLDHVRQECKRIEDTQQKIILEKKNKRDAFLKNLCEDVEIQIKKSLSQDELSCRVKIPENITSTELIESLHLNKGIPLNTMTPSPKSTCPCGSAPASCGCCCSDSVLNQWASNITDVLITFKKMCS